MTRVEQGRSDPRESARRVEKFPRRPRTSPSSGAEMPRSTVGLGGAKASPKEAAGPAKAPPKEALESAGARRGAAGAA